MQVNITAVGPDNRCLADPIIHHVTAAGANIHEIQMYDRDEEKVFAMFLRLRWPGERESLSELRDDMKRLGDERGLSIRTWSRGEKSCIPRLALCTTHRTEPALAVLRAIRDDRLKAVPAVMIGNRPSCRSVAEQFKVPWFNIGDDKGEPDQSRMVELFDEYDADYIVLARYMRILPAATCWRFAGGRIINLHHGLLPSFPGPHPYEDAYACRMLTYGGTVHFIVPELDAGNQIIHQSTFSVLPGTALEDVRRIGHVDHEPTCLVEGLRRVIDQEVDLHFNRVIRPK
jgi:formyltetrahydrofolate deformylase